MKRRMFATRASAANPTDGSSRSRSNTGFVVLTADLEFANELVYPPATHHGVVLVRLPGALLAPMLVQAIVAAIAALSVEDLVATIVIVEAGRIRIRRATSS
jgi:hypothetical protein